MPKFGFRLFFVKIPKASTKRRRRTKAYKDALHDTYGASSFWSWSPFWGMLVLSWITTSFGGSLHKNISHPYVPKEG